VAVLDIISPCVTFNNADESTKSYSYGKEHEVQLHDITFVPEYTEIAVDYEPGEVVSVKLHDGDVVQLRKLSKDHDPTNKLSALKMLEDSRRSGELTTGVVYINESRETILDTEGVHDTPIALLPERLLRPSKDVLDKVMAEFA
jgi:2-oxoglutarate/2-oxoacid ferredoxin oxidoreductase subunit beta